MSQKYRLSHVYGMRQGAKEGESKIADLLKTLIVNKHYVKCQSSRHSAITRQQYHHALYCEMHVTSAAAAAVAWALEASSAAFPAPAARQCSVNHVLAARDSAVACNKQAENRRV